MWERCTCRNRAGSSRAASSAERHVQEEDALGGMHLGVVALRLDPADAVDRDRNDAVAVAGEEARERPGRERAAHAVAGAATARLRRGARARARRRRPGARGRRA